MDLVSRGAEQRALPVRVARACPEPVI
jgi:hypothetical protein